jgi:hypothetical protein
MIGLIVGGVVLLMIAGGAIGAYFLVRGGATGFPGSSVLVNSNCTRENARKLRAGMTPEQASQILGDGRACDINEIIEASNASFDQDHQGEAAMSLIVGEKSCAAESWYRWQKAGCHVFAGFRKSKTGVNRLVFAQLLHQMPGGVFMRDELVIWYDHLQGDLDRSRAN